ncbi:MAG: hypothetical protein ABFE07_19145 [Armatimonadia bacterium]
MVPWLGELGLAGVCLGWIAMILLWDHAYLLLAIDDAFYYLKTAVNIAHGYGSTFDQINQTNGYHPLWMGLMVLLAKLTSSAAPLMRLALITEVLCAYAGLRVLMRFRSLRASALPAFAALAFGHFYGAKVLVNGLEASLQWLLLCVTLVYLWRLQSRETLPAPRQVALLGILSGLTVLARLDAVFFAVPALLTPLWLPGPRWPSAAPAARLKLALVGLAACGLVLAPYLAWNALEFGHLMPVSGAVKAGWGGSRVPLLIRAAGVAFFLAIAFWLTVGARRRVRVGAEPGALFWLAPLALSICFVSAYNICFIGRWLPYIWYAVPHLLLLLLALTLWYQHGSASPTRARNACLALAVWVLFSVLTWRQWLDPACYAFATESMQAARWLEDNSAPDAVVGSWDCGILGAYTSRRLMNLDGLINSWEYKAYLDSGKTEEFISKVHPADYLVEPFYPERLKRSNMLFRGVQLGQWHVQYSQPLRRRSVIRSWITEDLVYLVLSRSGPGPLLPEYLDSL